MKIKNSFLLFLILGTSSLWGQHENDNWRFGNSKWRFDNTAPPNGFVHTTNLTPSIRYGSSTISDKNTGDLLFYSNGYNIYNKNNAVMDNGNDLFGVSQPEYNYIGNPSDQSSIIVPMPNSASLYYVFTINGNRTLKDQDFIPSPNPVTNYGLRYAIVDMSLNGGMGKVISKNNVLFTNSPTNALTSTFASDGSSYWIVTANNGNFLSYKLDASGLNTNPVVSPGTSYGSFIKISPNSKKLLTRGYQSVWLHNFDNATGSITSPVNIIANNSFTASYDDDSDSPNSAEFSPDSNIVYFISASACLCLYPAGLIGWSGLSMYNISTGSLVGAVNTSAQYEFSLNGRTASMQLAKNGKIYLIYNSKQQNDGYGYYNVYFGSTIPSTSVFTSFNWGVINTPNVWSPTVNPLSSITPQSGTVNGFSFPQLIPSFDNAANSCPDVLTITTPVTSSHIYQAGKSIYASSAINTNIAVDYKAGINVDLLPGFYMEAAGTNGVFNAYISPCSINSFNSNSAAMGRIMPAADKALTVPASSEVKIYPNPASTIVNIDAGNSKISGWILYDLSGKSVLSGNSTTISVVNLPKSSYLLNIKLDNGKSISKKIIVQ